MFLEAAGRTLVLIRCKNEEMWNLEGEGAIVSQAFLEW